MEDSSGELVYVESTNQLKNSWEILSGQDVVTDWNTADVRVEFITPTRIKNNGKITSNIDFSVLRQVTR